MMIIVMTVNRKVVLAAGLLLGINQMIVVLVQTLTASAVLVNRTALFGWVGHPVGVALLVGLGIAVAIRLAAGPLPPLSRWGLALVLAGGLSNILDRLIWGGVIDYWSFGDWSTFNLADLEIIVGAVLLAIPDIKNGPPVADRV